MSDLSRIRCAGCRQTVAFSSAPTTLRNKVYCTPYCAEQYPATPETARNLEWSAWVELFGVSPVKVARDYGVAHSLVYKTVARQRQAS